MNEDQPIEAAEREIDLYRAEVTRVTAERDRLRDGITALAEDLEHSAAATAPSKKSAIEETAAQRLRVLLESP